MDTLIAIHEIHGVEVDGKKTVVAPGKPFIPNTAKQRDSLLKNGAAKKASKDQKAITPDTVATDDNADEAKPVADMTLKELVAYAAANNIDLGEAKLKQDVQPIVLAAVNATGDAESEEDLV